VPATVEADIENGWRATGLRDEALVRTEPFSQWVIEDRFAGRRPAWEAGGALFVPDVEPYESAKLRLLNGAHSTIAWLGYLAGFRHVDEVMRDEAMQQFVRYLMRREISPAAPEPEGMGHGEYIEALLQRFGNASLAHRTWQIAMDSSQKLPQRLLATLRLQLGRNGTIDGLCLAIAAWMRYAQGRDDAGSAIEISDPLRERFAALATANDAEAAAGFLSIREIFGADLKDDPRVTERVGRYLGEFRRLGARGTVRRFLASGDRT
jgi:fructuronate reductase